MIYLSYSQRHWLSRRRTLGVVAAARFSGVAADLFLPQSPPLGTSANRRGTGGRHRHARNPQCFLRVFSDSGFGLFSRLGRGIALSENHTVNKQALSEINSRIKVPTYPPKNLPQRRRGRKDTENSEKVRKSLILGRAVFS